MEDIFFRFQTHSRNCSLPSWWIWWCLEVGTVEWTDANLDVASIFIGIVFSLRQATPPSLTHFDAGRCLTSTFVAYCLSALITHTSTKGVTLSAYLIVCLSLPNYLSHTHAKAGNAIDLILSQNRFTLTFIQLRAEMVKTFGFAAQRSSETDAAAASNY